MVPFLVLLLALSACQPAAGPPSEPSVEIRESDEGFLVLESGQPSFFYRLVPSSLDGRWERSNYVHPLYGMDGEVLTEDFPEDHRHHRGVFWAWHQVLVGDVRAGDQWLAQSFSWHLQSASVLDRGDGLRVVHRWHSPEFLGGDQPILEEIAEVTVQPSGPDERLVDFDIRLSPLQEGVRLGGSEDDKGYGGFSVRVRMIEDLQFSGPGGPVSPDRRAMPLGDWVDFSGDFSGNGHPSGIAVFVHPESEGYPQPWILRSPQTPSMQNPVWPGAEPRTLRRGESVRLRYRLAVHRGHAEPQRMARLAAEYASLP